MSFDDIWFVNQYLDSFGCYLENPHNSSRSIVPDFHILWPTSAQVEETKHGARYHFAFPYDNFVKSKYLSRGISEITALPPGRSKYINQINLVTRRRLTNEEAEAETREAIQRYNKELAKSKKGGKARRIPGSSVPINVETFEEDLKKEEEGDPDELEFVFLSSNALSMEDWGHEEEFGEEVFCPNFNLGVLFCGQDAFPSGPRRRKTMAYVSRERWKTLETEKELEFIDNQVPDRKRILFPMPFEPRLGKDSHLLERKFRTERALAQKLHFY